MPVAAVLVTLILGLLAPPVTHANHQRGAGNGKHTTLHYAARTDLSSCIPAMRSLLFDRADVLNVPQAGWRPCHSINIDRGADAAGLSGGTRLRGCCPGIRDGLVSFTALTHLSSAPSVPLDTPAVGNLHEEQRWAVDGQVFALCTAMGDLSRLLAVCLAQYNASLQTLQTPSFSFGRRFARTSPSSVIPTPSLPNVPCRCLGGCGASSLRECRSSESGTWSTCVMGGGLDGRCHTEALPGPVRAEEKSACTRMAALRVAQDPDENAP
ncbi:hypothetical protein C8R45DRAFT_1108075 [Mycena sanguinolenta]|nr:hypothetical protein C8R45DRAFT_1108075 [Mycena sanguinolenta]